VQAHKVTIEVILEREPENDLKNEVMMGVVNYFKKDGEMEVLAAAVTSEVAIAGVTSPMF
jgi:hypothetical protein